MCLMHPVLFWRYYQIPKNYVTLDEWMEVDEKECDIFAQIIGCKNAEHLKEQQRENMAIRKMYTNTFAEWMKIDGEPRRIMMESHIEIAEKYRSEGKCHRQYEGKDAGVRCFCKK
ncbi:MAG: hypothetical protein WC878_06945 [Candidatus Paceibacterota bacterium]